MKYYLGLYRFFFRFDIRRIFMYRANLVSSSLGYLLESVGAFFSIWLIIRTTHGLGGWNSVQVIALFSYTLFLITTWEFFFVNTMEIPEMISNGQLDIFLIRPVSDLYQFIIFELDEESIFEMVTSLIILIITFFHLGVIFNVVNLLFFIGNTVSALLAFEAIYLTICSSAFWFQSSSGLEIIIYQIIQLTRYPITIYPKLIQLFLTVLPFGLYGYYPLRVLFFRNSLWTNIYTLLAGPAFFLLAYFFVWKRGLKHYTSSAG